MNEAKPKVRRRDAEQKAKARAIRRLAPLIRSPGQPLRLIDFARVAGKLACTPTPCSCPKCGNRRRYAKGANCETLAETKARLGKKEEIDAWTGTEGEAED